MSPFFVLLLLSCGAGLASMAQTSLYSKLGGGLTLPLQRAIFNGQAGLQLKRPLDKDIWLGGGMAYQLQSFSLQSDADRRTGSVHIIKLHNLHLPVIVGFKTANHPTAPELYGGAYLAFRLVGVDRYTIRQFPLGEIMSKSRTLSSAADEKVSLGGLAGLRFAVGRKGCLFTEYQHDFSNQKLQSAKAHFKTSTVLIGIEWLLR